MQWQWNPFGVAALVGFSVVLAMMAVVLWRRERPQASGEFLWVGACIAVTSLGMTVDLFGADAFTKRVGLSLNYLGFIFLPQMVLRFSLVLTGRERLLTTWRWWALLAPSALALCLYVTNPWHHLMERSSELVARPGFVMRHAVAGPGFWAWALYAYVLLALSSLVYLREAMLGSFLGRRLTWVFFLGTLPPWAANTLFLAGASPDPDLDLTLFGHVATMVTWTVAVTRGRFLDLSPVAREVVFETLPDPVVVIDARGRVVDVNPAMARLLSRRVEVLVGGPLAETSIAAAAESHEVRLGDRVFSVARSNLQTRGARGEVLLLRDVTTQARAEEAERSAAAEARALARARADFLARVSHEVRTPLHGVMGALELGLDEALSPRARQLLESALRSADGMLEVVNEVLDHARLESGVVGLDADDFEPGAIARDVVALFEARASQKGLSLTVEAPEAGHVRGDAGKLRQVALNLVGNAVKFTAAGGVVVRVDVRGQRLRLEVEDSGPGIPASARARLFQPFEQLGSRAGGTGLGLSIVRRLVEAMGGSVVVDDAPTGGARFVVDVPVAPTLGPAPRAVMDETARFEGVVLVVDDHPLGRQLSARLLAREGCTVRTAASGLEAIDEVRRAPPDLVLLDVRLPDLDGPQTLARLRSEGFSNAVVWLTADVARPSELEAAPAQGLLPKPFRRPELRAVLSAHLRVAATPASASTVPEPDDADVLKLFEQTSLDEIERFSVAELTDGRGALHDLHGSAALVGATALVAACREVADSGPSGAARDRLLAARAADLERLARRRPADEGRP